MDASQTTLAFLSALCSAIAATFAWGSGYLDRDSRTTVTFLSATESVITISATNAGKRPSVIRSAWLHFDGLPIGEAELELFRDGDKTESNAVPGSGNATIRYTVRGLPRSVAYEELERRLIAQRNDVVTLVIHVQESDDSRAHPTSQEEPIPVHKLEELILAKVPQREEGS